MIKILKDRKDLRKTRKPIDDLVHQDLDLLVVRPSVHDVDEHANLSHLYPALSQKSHGENQKRERSFQVLV